MIGVPNAKLIDPIKVVLKCEYRRFYILVISHGEFANLFGRLSKPTTTLDCMQIY